MNSAEGCTHCRRSLFEKDFLRPIPLVKQFFHEIILAAQSEANGTLIDLVTGIADHISLHLGNPQFLYNFLSLAGLSEFIIVHQIAMRTPRVLPVPQEHRRTPVGD